MIKKIITAGFLLLLVNSFVMAQSKDETAVATAVESLRKAMLDADKANLDKYTAPELSYGHSSGRVETKAEFVESLVTGKSDFTSINLTDQTIKMAGNTAIVRHVLAGETNDNGNKATVKLSILTIWQKQKGEWKLLARQAVRLPQ
jgi:ketosteroid isomerase-like protein